MYFGTLFTWVAWQTSVMGWVGTSYTVSASDVPIVGLHLYLAGESSGVMR